MGFFEIKTEKQKNKIYMFKEKLGLEDSAHIFIWKKPSTPAELESSMN